MYNHKNTTRIRKLEKDDLEDLLYLKEDSWWGTHTTHLLNMEDQERWYNSLPKSTICLIVNAGEVLVREVVRIRKRGNSYSTTRSKDAAVAIISEIDHINRTAKLSGSVYEYYRTENVVKAVSEAVLDYCFEMLNFNRIDCEVLECNYAAQKYWTQHLGFVVEGKRRQAVYKCGEYYDSLMLGMLRTDWLKNCWDRGLSGSCNTNFDHDTAKKLVERSRNYLQPVDSGTKK